MPQTSEPKAKQDPSEGVDAASKSSGSANKCAQAAGSQPSKSLAASQDRQDCQDHEDAEKMKRRAKSHKTWNRRLKFFFCCLGYKKNKDSIADVASTFAEFYSELDVPSSDLAAGFVLLSKYQEAQRRWVLANQHQLKGASPLGQFGQPLPVEQYLSSVAITRDTKFVDVSQAADCQLINELIYYMNYSLAIFGWPLQMIDEPHLVCCICPYLRCGSWCCCCCSCSSDKYEPGDEWAAPVVLDDNCCGCNMASAERRLAAHNYEVIYVNYKVKVNVVPFMVAADHSKRTIVIAIRGSMSQADMVTDMNGHADKLPIENCPDDWLSHRGITSAAKYVHDTLVECKILERAFGCRPDLASDQYNIVICGHSLGAGAASILGVLLRPRYPKLRAYLYSPPGGILSLPVVEYTKQFATGILLGNDCVPRLGLAQLERLRYYLLLSLKNSNLSTSKILARAFCSSCCFGKTQVDYDPDLSVDVLHGTSGQPFEYSGNVIPFQCQKQVLYVPGRLIHVVKNYDSNCLKPNQSSNATPNSDSPARRGWFGRKSSAPTSKRRRRPIYQAVWTENTDYDKIMISEGMLYDHLPNRLMHSMKMLMSKTLPRQSSRAQPAAPPAPGFNEEKLKLGGCIRSYRSFERPDSKPVIDEKKDSKDDENNNESVERDDNNNSSDSSCTLDDHERYHDCELGSKLAPSGAEQS